MLDATDRDNLADIVAAASTFGSASRNDLLGAAVAARSPAVVIEAILALPEGYYRNIEQITGTPVSK